MAEPLPAVNLTGAPEWLNWMTGSQQVIWDDIRANAPSGQLKHLDSMALARWCRLADEYGAVAADLAKLEGDARYGELALVLRRILRDDNNMMRALETELGLTPAARPRLQVAPEPNESTSPFEKLMG